MAKMRAYFIKESGILEVPKEVTREQWLKRAEENGFYKKGQRHEPVGWASDSTFGFTRMVEAPDDEEDIIMKEFMASGGFSG